MDIAKLLGDIAHINEKFSDKEWVKKQNGNVLSFTAVHLAAMKAYLLDAKQDALREMLEAEVLMDAAKARAYRKALEATNATAAKDGKYDDEDFMEARRDYNEAKVNYERLKSIVADSHDLLESIRSRNIDLNGARRDDKSL